VDSWDIWLLLHDVKHESRHPGKHAKLIDAFRETLKSFWREQAWMDLPKLYFCGFDDAC
jgi:hypothetical protein